MNRSTKIKKSGHAILRSIAGERVIVPIAGHLANMERVFIVNEVGEYIWSRLDGEAALDVIAGGMAEDFDVDKSTAAADIHDFITALQEYDLAEEA